MRTALITTTINVPRVLALYRKLGPDVRFFVTGDKKTPQEAYDFCDSIPDCVAGRETSQIGWKCSELIGWNQVERRNIALLEAIRWGADCVVTIDDDNIPIDGNYFKYFEDHLSIEPWFCVEASSPTGWFDPGTLLVPPVPHRGFPYAQKAAPVFDSVVDARIGVAAGLCLGDPDIDAVTRIVNAPVVHSVSELARAGVVTDPRKTKTVFNTQNTAFIRDLAPAMFQPPGVGRFSDIYASLICQRVMRERGLYVHFGMPYVWQTRNEHNLINDLRLEIDGMANIEALAGILDAMQLPDHDVLAATRRIYSALQATATTIMPPIACQAALAFFDDMESIL